MIFMEIFLVSIYFLDQANFKSSKKRTTKFACHNLSIQKLFWKTVRKDCSWKMFAFKFDAKGLRFEIVTGGLNQIFYLGAIRILVGTIGGVETYRKKLEDIYLLHI